ncbi:MAG: hypothetical protein HY098_09245 [Nitrospinae bacterium]|nr:hypothetical protein [Nitrospinota bacterium]
MALAIDEIKEYAKSLGINTVSKIKKKDTLIHAIQLAEGNTDCFKKIPDCTLTNCKWFGDCILNQ